MAEQVTSPGEPEGRVLVLAYVNTRERHEWSVAGWRTDELLVPGEGVFPGEYGYPALHIKHLWGPRVGAPEAPVRVFIVAIVDRPRACPFAAARIARLVEQGRIVALAWLRQQGHPLREQEAREQDQMEQGELAYHRRRNHA